MVDLLKTRKYYENNNIQRLKIEILKKIWVVFIISSCFSQGYNMELLGYLNFDQECSDIIGFYQDEREFAVVGLYSSTVFVDITNPEVPFETGRINGGDSSWRDIKYWDRYIYIGTEADVGIQVVSVDNPDVPILTNLIEDFTNSHNIHIADGFLYVVGASTYDLWIYELSNPSIPNLAGTWNQEYIHDLHVYNNKAYCAAIYSSTIYILDVRNKEDIYELTSWSYEGKAHDCAVTSDETILVTADEMAGGHMKVWDIDDYNNIELLGEYIVDPNHTVHNVFNIENLVYCSYYADGTRVVDISNPQNPVEIGYYDTSELESLFVGNWGVDPFLPSGNIISSDIETGLYITRLTGISIFHDPIEDVSMDDESYSIESTILSYSAEIVSASINYRLIGTDNESWINLSLSENINNMFNTELPKQNIGTIVQYYIYAINEYNEEQIFPVNGEVNPLMFVVEQLPILYDEEFEYENGWSIGSEDDANSGVWVRGVPNPTYIGDNLIQTDTDHTLEGEECYITGNTYMPFDPGLDDIDDGVTTLISPIYDLTDYDNVLLKYWLWYTNNLGENPYEDYWQVDISNDSGLNWINLENLNASSTNWQLHRIILSEFIEMTDEVILRFKASDLNNPSLVEAGIDDISLEAFGNPIILGDINFDISIDILDIVLVVQLILGIIQCDIFELQAADYDMNGFIEVLDIVSIIEVILG